MQMVMAVIQPSRLGPVREALLQAGIAGMTVTEARGFGLQGGITGQYRGAEYRIDFLPKLRVEVVLKDDQVAPAVDAITEAARTGNIGDGKIFVSPVTAVYRIRTGEKDNAALV